jgi:hypothetical protein
MEDAAFIVSAEKFSVIWAGDPAAKRAHNCRENPLLAAQVFHAQLLQIFAVFYSVDLGEK